MKYIVFVIMWFITFVTGNIIILSLHPKIIDQSRAIAIHSKIIL